MRQRCAVPSLTLLFSVAAQQETATLPPLKRAASVSAALVNEAVKRGSSDNVSALVVLPAGTHATEQ